MRRQPWCRARARETTDSREQDDLLHVFTPSRWLRGTPCLACRVRACVNGDVHALDDPLHVTRGVGGVLTATVSGGKQPRATAAWHTPFFRRHFSLPQHGACLSVRYEVLFGVQAGRVHMAPKWLARRPSPLPPAHTRDVSRRPRTSYPLRSSKVSLVGTESCSHQVLKLVKCLRIQQREPKLRAAEGPRVRECDVSRLATLAQHPHDVAANYAHLRRWPLATELQILRRKRVTASGD